MRVLVAYASKRGSTAEIAEVVAARLREEGFEVHRHEAAEVDDLAPYDAIVLGSAVYMKRWRGDARHFLRKHRRELATRPFWIFSSGPVGDPAKDDPAWTEPAKIVSRAEELGVRDHVVFGGRVPAEPHGPIERSMVDNTPAEFRDRRDWARIKAWAGEVAAQLAAVSAPG